MELWHARIETCKRYRIHSLDVQHLNFDNMFVPRGYTYYDKKIRIDRNPIRTAMNVCKQLISKRVSISETDMGQSTKKKEISIKVREWTSERH